MRIALYGNPTDKSKLIKSELEDKINQSKKLKLCQNNPNIVISVGGDGTFLSAFHHFIKDIDNIRFIGVNTGHLGFYTDWMPSQIDQLIESLNHDDQKSVSYSLLSIGITYKNTNKTQHLLALNESAIKRISTTMIADVYVNRSFIEKYRGDGLCISNSTGSTAYNKSLGGAVVCPAIDSMQLTTIAPLSNKEFRALNSPIVLPSHHLITVIPKEDLKNIVTDDNTAIAGRAIKRLTFKVSDKHRVHFARYKHVPFWTRVNKSFVGR